MGREDYSLVYGGKLRPGMLVLDIGGNARDGAVPGVGGVEEITDITPAANSRGKEQTRFACKTKLFEARDQA